MMIRMRKTMVDISIPPEIDSIIIIDRKVDLISPLVGFVD